MYLTGCYLRYSRCALNIPVACLVPTCLPTWWPVVSLAQVGCRSKRVFLEDATTAVRSKNIPGAVFCYVAAARFQEAVDLAIKDFEGREGRVRRAGRGGKHAIAA